MTPTGSNVDPISLFLVIAALSVLPFAAMVVTSYTKIVVVLGLLRNAIGVQQVPPNMVLNGIAMIISCYVMAPVYMQTLENVNAGTPNQPTVSHAETLISAAEFAREPMRTFLRKHAAEREIQFFLKSASAIWPPEQAQALRHDDMLVLAPAFLLTELSAAFRIGFLLYLAFIIVDIVIANVLLAMGLSQVTPTNVAIPLKLLLFVVMDGWSRLIHGLILTYH